MFLWFYYSKFRQISNLFLKVAQQKSVNHPEDQNSQKRGASRLAAPPLFLSSPGSIPPGGLLFLMCLSPSGTS